MANPWPSPATRFRPGQSGNPNGRTPGKGIGAVLREKLAEPDDEGRTPADRIADAMIALAVKGDVRAASFISDRAEGKPRQAVVIEEDYHGGDWLNEFLDGPETSEEIRAQLMDPLGASELPNPEEPCG